MTKSTTGAIKAKSSHTKKKKNSGIPTKELILKFAADAYCKGSTGVVPDKPTMLTKDKLIQLTGLAKKTVLNNLAKLKKEGLVEYPAPQFLALTAMGVAHMGEHCQMLTPTERASQFLQELNGKSLALYDLLKDGESRCKEDVAQDLNFEGGRRQKGFQNLIGKWKTAGMVEYPSKDKVKMTHLWLGE